MSNLIRTEGILLRRLSYGEQSVIVHVLTAEQGLVHLIVNGVRSSKSKGKAGALQLGHILEVVYYHHATKDLYRLKEVRIAHQYRYPGISMYRLASIQYLIELTAETLYQQGQLPAAIYPLLRSKLLAIDDPHPPPYIAVTYLWQLIQVLGWAPEEVGSHTGYLHLTSGGWVAHPAPDDLYLSAAQVGILQQVLAVEHEEDIHPAQAAMLIDVGHAYMTMQLQYFKTPKTLSIYRDVLLNGVGV